MESYELSRQLVTPQSTTAPLPADVPQITVMGIHGASDFAVAIVLDGVVLKRDGLVLDRMSHQTVSDHNTESLDALTIRAARLSTSLTVSAKHDAWGFPMAYLIYKGLPDYFCKTW